MATTPQHNNFVIWTIYGHMVNFRVSYYANQNNIMYNSEELLERAFKNK